MSVVDKTNTISVRFRVQWSYSGLWGVGKRLARWVHLRLQKYKLTTRFNRLTSEANGDYRIEILEEVKDSPTRGGFEIAMTGDTWHMGKFVRPILNEPSDTRASAIKSVIQSEFGDLFLTNTSVDTEIDVVTYSVGKPPSSPT